MLNYDSTPQSLNYHTINLQGCLNKLWRLSGVKLMSLVKIDQISQKCIVEQLQK